MSKEQESFIQSLKEKEGVFRFLSSEEIQEVMSLLIENLEFSQLKKAKKNKKIVG